LRFHVALGWYYKFGIMLAKRQVFAGQKLVAWAFWWD